MRQNPSPVEERLWRAIKAKRLSGIKFSHQVVIGPYIGDFVCRSQKLVIELDGDSHASSEGYDVQRTRWLESKGYRVIRFANNEVIGNLEGVLTAIAVALAAPLSQPSPRRGEGLK